MDDLSTLALALIVGMTPLHMYLILPQARLSIFMQLCREAKEAKLNAYKHFNVLLVPRLLTLRWLEQFTWDQTKIQRAQQYFMAKGKDRRRDKELK